MIAAPVYVHPDRSGALKSKGANRLLVIHTTEGGEGNNSAEGLASLLANAGDRPNGSGGVYGSSYHWIIDTDRYIPAVPESVVAYAAAGANHDGIHFVIPGKAGQTREQWLDETSSKYLDVLAVALRDRGQANSIPLTVRLTAAQIRAGHEGICDHYGVTLAYGRSTHTDVGPGFPWDELSRRLDLLTRPPTPTAPKEEPSMKLGVYRTHDGRGTTLIGQCTPNGGALVVRWARSEAKEVAPILAHPDGIEFQNFRRGHFGACALLGPIPPGWTADDFGAVIQ